MSLKKTLCALLAVLLLVPMWTVPVTAAETGTVLYHQKAPATFEEGKQVWPTNSSSGSVYQCTYRGVDGEESFNTINYTIGESALPKRADGTIETVTITLPQVQLDTGAYGEIELRYQYIVYGFFLRIDMVNDFRIYVSTDGGKTWSKNYADMKSHKMLGVGNGPDMNFADMGTYFECFEVVSEDLSALVNEGQVINAVKIQPYGDYQLFQYRQCTKEISVLGYGDKSPVKTYVPQYQPMDEATMRAVVVNRAYETADVEWTPTVDFVTYNSSLPSDREVFYKAGYLYRGPCYARGLNSTQEMLKGAVDAEGIYHGGTTWSTVVGLDCIGQPSDALSAITAARTINSWMYYCYGANSTLVGGLKSTDYADQYKDVFETHSEQEVYEAYAKMNIGDMFLAAHGMLLTAAPKVVRYANGKIDPYASKAWITDAYVTYRYYFLRPDGTLAICNDEDVAAYQAKNPTYTYLYGETMRKDSVHTFAQLYDTGYLPSTLTEFKSGKVEKVQTSVTTKTTGDNVVRDGFFAIVHSNYHVNTLVCILTDAEGKQLYSKTWYGEVSDFDAVVDDAALNATLKGLSAGSYKLTLDARTGPITRVGGRIPNQRVYELTFTV